MTILDEGIEDLNGRYTGAGFLATIKGKEELIYTREFIYDNERNPFVVCATIPSPNRQDSAWQTLPLKGLEFREWYPEKGLYNVAGSVKAMCEDNASWLPQLFVRRNTDRQWHHGISRRTIHISGLFSRLLRDFLRDPMERIDFSQEPSMWYALWKPEWPSYVEAIESANRLPGGVALNTTFGLLANPGGPGILLHRLGRFIGKAYPDMIEVKDNMFAQEIKDFARRAELNVKVNLG